MLGEGKTRQKMRKPAHIQKQKDDIQRELSLSQPHQAELSPSLANGADSLSQMTPTAEPAPQSKPLQRQTMPQTMISYASGTPTPIQTKLRVGAANDRYEQEAEQVAEQVVGRESGSKGQKSGIQREPMISPIQRKGGESGFETNQEFDSNLSRANSGGSPLPDRVRREFEPKMGADLSQVRVHTGSESASLNNQIQAKAFTHGRDIHFNAGQYQPNTVQGKRLLAHEVTHTVQQGYSPIQRQTSNSPIRYQNQASSTTIQPARGRFGRILGSVLSLGTGAKASADTYGSKKERRASPKRTAVWYSKVKDISVQAGTGTLKGKKYTPDATKQGTDVNGSGKGKVILMLSGSGGSNFSQLRPVADQYCKEGSIVYGIDYRGYGDSSDNPMLSEEGFNHDAKAMFNYVTSDAGVSASKIVIHGFSLGGAIATKLVKSLAKQKIKIGGLVLHSAIDSAYKAARDTLEDTGDNSTKEKVGAFLLKWLGLSRLGGAITKGAAGNFDTRAKLKEISKLDPDLPIHLMSGGEKDGDQLSLDSTGLREKAKKGFKNVTSHVSGGDHLNTNQHMNDPGNLSMIKKLLEKDRK